MPDFNQVTPFFEYYLQQWLKSPTSQRIVDVESAAIATGRASNWEGPTVTDFWIGVLQEYTELLRAHPELLKTSQQLANEQEAFRGKLQNFLEEEQTLIDRADELTAQLDSYKLGWLDPRYHKTQTALANVVKQFRLVDDKYQLNLKDLN